jgi:DNA-binding GntR family transcriptional regulator
MTLTKIPCKLDFVDKVYDTLLTAITDGRLSPGTRIKQEELADQLQVSRSPVLQALRLLKKDGLLCEGVGRGLVVATVDDMELVQLYQMRGAIDALAARLAAHQCACIPKQVLELGAEAQVIGDVGAMIDADAAFHQAVYEASGNAFVVGSAAMHWVRVRRAQGRLLQYRGGWSHICTQHLEIAEAIREGDADLAARLSESHTLLAHHSLATHLISAGGTGLPGEMGASASHGQNRQR